MADGAAPVPAPVPAAGEATGAKKKRWFPLESNPGVMNKYIENLGFPTTLFKWHDVLSTDDWALGMVPAPIKAITLLFPIKEATEAHRAAEKARIEEAGQVVAKDLWYTKQTVGNACGTVALFHAAAAMAAQNGGELEYAADSYFKRFFDRTKGMTPDERAADMEADDELEVAHDAGAQDEQSQTAAEMNVVTHFVCFVPKDGNLYELDGRKAFPINHGPTTDEGFAADCMKVVKQFMARDEGEMRFTILALAPNSGEEEG